MTQAAAQATVDRNAERRAYLAGTAFASATLEQLGSDASIRQYFRLHGGPVPALLMDAPSAATTPPCPPSATAAERAELGYGALVRGSGSSLIAFEAAAKLLASRGLLVPQVITSDASQGFAIVEDLGEVRVADAALRPEGEAKLYAEAADILDRLRVDEAKAGDVYGWPFQTYDDLAYRAEAALLTEWFLPFLLKRKVSDEAAAELDQAWTEVFQLLSEPRHLVHRDFHADNLMQTADGIAVIDFQDLMIGQAAYDWASLIEDARRDVSQELRDSLYNRGVRNADDPGAFAADYAILAAQRNAKILGLFARLAERDGKRRYLDLIPRVQRFFKEDLARPQLAPVKTVISRLAPELLV